MTASRKTAKVARAVAKTQAPKPAPKGRATKAPPVNNDLIISVVPARTGNGLVISTASINATLKPWQDTAATRKLAVVGGSMAKLREHVATLKQPEGKLARGLDSHNAPHSAKAAADSRKANSTIAAKEPAKGKGKARTAKAAKAKQPAKGSNRAYTLAGRKDESKPDTFRRYMLATIMGAKDTDSAKAKHAKSGKYPTHKLDFNWAAQQGYIKFTA